jgi:hypothetical protein
MRIVSRLLVLFSLVAGSFPWSPVSIAEAQPTPPDSSETRFLHDLDVLTRAGGRWLADNGAYTGPNEPWQEYGLQWRTGLSGRTGHGRLFGIEADGSERDFWEFFLYWDPIRRAAVIIQVFASGAAFGIGDMHWLETGAQETIQTFRWADGSTTETRHLEQGEGDERHCQSFDRVDGEWQARRTYVWRRVPVPDGGDR